MKIELKIENEMDIVTDLATHPHNETLQFIDAKIARLNETLTYLSSTNKSPFQREILSDRDECLSRINKLGKTKHFLLNDHDVETFLMQSDFYE